MFVFLWYSWNVWVLGLCGLVERVDDAGPGRTTSEGDTPVLDIAVAGGELGKGKTGMEDVVRHGVGFEVAD